MDATWLFVSSIVSLIGTVILLYGWRQRLGAPTLVGLALSVYPYFIDSVVVMTLIGIALFGVLIIAMRMEQDV